MRWRDIRKLLVSTLLLVITATSAAARPHGLSTLHENGDPDGVNGYSNGTVEAIGARRTLLDDFVIPVGEVWIIEALEWHHVWGNENPPAFAAQVGS